ncbi:hypothetical protein P344_01465 [Spiroplasma mirum ATCC 29335]|uniref:Uncharacterized protein n=1 Tax=Spiroplasma mirum ATCC 29335 TaxID=838561 RepID=W0GQ79_9MOLU|nr:hypothetical protein SMM_0240 [Spiroplasma mirum ATCC 29335]AHI57658.1 hypothetical protein P344_01465 [Spiroplasma mirum ATCC 29335]
MVKAWNSLLQNQVIINNFNQQFKTMGVDISLRMGLQSGQMLISGDTKNYLKLSGEEIKEDNDHITITEIYLVIFLINFVRLYLKFQQIIFYYPLVKKIMLKLRILKITVMIIVI